MEEQDINHRKSWFEEEFPATVNDIDIDDEEDETPKRRGGGGLSNNNNNSLLRSHNSFGSLSMDEMNKGTTVYEAVSMDSYLAMQLYHKTAKDDKLVFNFVLTEETREAAIEEREDDEIIRMSVEPEIGEPQVFESLKFVDVVAGGDFRFEDTAGMFTPKDEKDRLHVPMLFLSTNTMQAKLYRLRYGILTTISVEFRFSKAPPGHPKPENAMVEVNSMQYEIKNWPPLPKPTGKHGKKRKKNRGRGLGTGRGAGSLGTITLLRRTNSNPKN